MGKDEAAESHASQGACSLSTSYLNIVTFLLSNMGKVGVPLSKFPTVNCIFS